MEGLRLENKALKDRVDTHEQERLSVEEGSQKNKEQLHDMAQMVSCPRTEQILGAGSADFCFRIAKTRDSVLYFLIPHAGLSTAGQSQALRVAQAQFHGSYAH